MMLVVLGIASLAICLCCHAQTTLSGPELILQGRFSPGLANSTAGVPQTFSWGASSIFTSFDGASSVTVTINALPANGSVTYGITWFRFFIDGKFAADGFTSYNQLALSVTLNVTSANHTLQIAKVTEAAKGEAILQSMELSTGGRFLPALQSTPTEKRILFLGDSYSVGYGNAGAVLPGTCQPTPQELQVDWVATCTALAITSASECADLWQVFNENSLEAFGPVAAAAFGADFQVIANTGSGMVGYSNAVDIHPDLTPAEYEAILPSDQAMFNRSVYADSTSLYPLQSWIPQVVVIASGTNDWHSVPPLYTLDEWIAQAVAFLQQVSTVFNQPTIILQAFPPEQQLAGVLNGTEGALNETIQYIQAMPSLFTQAVREKVPNIQYLQLNTENYDDLYLWCDGHPSAVADRAIASQLVSFIEAVQPGWNASQVSSAINETAIRPDTSLYSSSMSGLTNAG